MPICGNVLHPASGLPRVQPASQFYQARGRCFWACKPCWRVYTSLRKQRVPRPWSGACIQAAWQRYWARQAHQARRAQVAPGERWCSRGHVAPTTAFGPTQHYCRACAAIVSLLGFYRDSGRVLTWEEAVRRHTRAKAHHSLLRNRLAPPGERWCSRHRGYFVVPPTWKAAWRLSWCNACRAVMQREYRDRAIQRRGRAAQQGAP